MKKIIMILIVMQLACMTSAAVGAVDAGRGRERDVPAVVPQTSTSTAVIETATSTPETRTICGTWNVREGASDAGPSLRYLYDGDAVTIITRRAGWVMISAGQWVSLRAVCYEH